MLSSSRTHCYRNRNNNNNNNNSSSRMKQEQEKEEVVVDEKKEDYTTTNVHDSVFDWGHNACCLNNSDYMVVPEDESIKMMQLERSMVNILATSATATTITSSAVTAASSNNSSSAVIINDDNEKEQYNNNNFNNAVDNDNNEYFDGDNENNNDDDDDINNNNNNDDDDDVDLLKNYPRFKKKELLIGKVLGSGTFGVVHEIRGFELRDDEDLNKDSSEGTKRRLSAIKTILLKKSSSSRINRRRGSPDSLPPLTRTKSQGNSSSRRGSWGQVLLRRGNSYKSHYDENNAQSNSNETMLGEFSGHSEDNNDDDDDATDNCKSERSEEEEEEEHHHREFIAKHCIRQTDSHKGHARYAIKSLKPELVNSTHGSDESNLLDQGMQDMEIETRFLSRLKHPNIIKMRAFANVKPDHKNYFIVMDRLYDTLEQRIKKWSKQRDTILQLQKPTNASSLIKQKGGRSRRRRGSGSGSNSRVNINGGNRRHSNEEVDADRPSNNNEKESEEKELLVERLNVAYDISSALFYLHSNNIIHRDLKPNNIGFDCRGDVKIFDFGLAKDIDEKNLVDTSNKNENDNDNDNSGYNFNFNDEVDKYNMTGMTGTIRYMAPEVAKCQPYNETCDTYSFIILLWQMLSLQKPYSELRSVDDFKTKVWRNPSREGQKPYRPQISYDVEDDELLYTKNKIWSTIPTIQILFERGWTNNLEERFHMIVVSNMLKREVESLCDGQLDYRRIINDGGSETEDGAHHQLRRRSTFVYKPKIIK